MTDIEEPTKHLPAMDTYRILTLEDPENIEQLKIACKEAGHQVVPVTTISQAMVFLETKDHVDVIVAAAHLQNESVFEFLGRIRSADSHLKSVPFIVLCADPGVLATVSSPAVEMVATLMGANKYLLMPEFSAARLMEEIEPLLAAIPRKELSPT